VYVFSLSQAISQKSLPPVSPVEVTKNQWISVEIHLNEFLRLSFFYLKKTEQVIFHGAMPLIVLPRFLSSLVTFEISRILLISILFSFSMTTTSHSVLLAVAGGWYWFIVRENYC